MGDALSDGMIGLVVVSGRHDSNDIDSLDIFNGIQGVVVLLLGYNLQNGSEIGSVCTNEPAIGSAVDVAKGRPDQLFEGCPGEMIAANEEPLGNKVLGHAPDGLDGVVLATIRHVAKIGKVLPDDGLHIARKVAAMAIVEEERLMDICPHMASNTAKERFHIVAIS